VLVGDRRQRQCPGTEILRRLIQIRRDEKLGRLIADVLPDRT
jgi:acetyltransferase